MSRRLRFVAIVLLLAAFLPACRKPASQGAPAGATPAVSPSPAPFAGLARIVVPHPSPEEVRKAPLPQAGELFDGLYRIPPDRRFLAGVAAAKRILRGGRASTVQASFHAGHWSVVCDGEDAGSLPEFPSYAEARTLLSDWTRRLGAAGPAAGGASPPGAEASGSISPTDLIGALTAIDRSWNPRSPDSGLARSAARASTLMLLQGIDHFELTNDIAGQALAAFAIAENLGARAPSEEALVCAYLGYPFEAKERASRLPASDPVRLFLEGKTASLKSLAEANPGNAFVGYLAVRSIPGDLGTTAWEAWVKAHFFTKERTLETLHAEIDLDRFESNARCAQGVIGTWMSRLDPEWAAAGEDEPPSSESKTLVQTLFDRYVESVREKLRRKPAGLLRRFEAGLARKPSTGPGPFWSADADRAWARASFYSAVSLLGRFYLDELSSEEGAASYALYLQDAPAGFAPAYVDWYRHLTAWKRGENPIDAVSADAGKAGLGYVAASRSLRDVQAAILEQRKPVAEILSAYAQQLDTRPDARYRLIEPLDKASETVQVLSMCRRLLEISNAPLQTWTAAWCASLLGDSRSLQRAAADPAQGIERRLRSLDMLKGRSDAKPDLLRAQYRRLVEEAKYTRPAVSSYIFYLDWLKDYAEELRVVDGYLANNPRDDMMHLIYVGRRAHCLSGLGRHAEAWKLIEPIVGSQQGAVMGWGAEILWELGRSEESLVLARRAVERYPDSIASRADLARLLWRAQRDSEAALVLADQRLNTNVYSWQREIADAFFEAFAKADAERAVRAFRVLQDQRVPFWNLEALALRLGQAGKAEHAFRLYEKLSGVGSYEYPWPKARAFEYLGRWKGDAAAIEWIDANFNPKMIPTTGPALYATGNYELLWILSVPGAEASDETWLLRAGGAALQGLDHAAHREQLLAHFQDAGSRPDARVHLGRHVLGLETAEELLRRPRKAEEEAEAAYFLGVRAYVEGRLLDAGEWLQLIPLKGKAHDYDAAMLRSQIARQISENGPSGRSGSGRGTARR